MTDNLVGVGDKVLFAGLSRRVIAPTLSNPRALVLEDAEGNVGRYVLCEHLTTPDGRQVTGFREREVPRAEVVPYKHIPALACIFLGDEAVVTHKPLTWAERVAARINRALGHEE